MTFYVPICPRDQENLSKVTRPFPGWEGSGNETSPIHSERDVTSVPPGVGVVLLLWGSVLVYCSANGGNYELRFSGGLRTLDCSMKLSVFVTGLCSYSDELLESDIS